MPHEQDVIRLQHMLDSSLEAMTFVAGKTRGDLEGNRQLQLAVVRCIEIIGEAAARISPEFRAEHAHIPWQRIIGTRNRLVHAYFDINLTLIWRTATEELPDLAAQLESLLRQ
jgi:uncharacterized protein with HEPN domain